MEYYSIFNTDWGWMGIVFNNAGLLTIVLPDNNKEFASFPIIEKFPHAQPNNDKGEIFSKKFIHYFSGKNPLFNFKLDLNAYTPFQKKVWKITSRIKYGEVSSYSEIGGELGNKNIARAIGSALKKNPLPIVIPCHRVVMANGELGGFSANSGTKFKAKLLEFEGIKLDKKQRVAIVK
ncbi:MAG: methylated-DNA--[protein]-cysteine S-methyltransferase [Thermodesulfobacteriota bacterium]|nr:methylated-DNA--[protein]-cysteine S-methyltransferase [Thermodesulfobacteriota bacterium]